MGLNHDSVTTSYSSGTIEGNERVGGLVSYNLNSITASYSTGMVLGDSCVGGLVGKNVNTYHEDAGLFEPVGTINDCYSTGSVTEIRTWEDCRAT